ncbi:helix-turn-helix domain-containing protein [Ruminococcus sp. Marseille-P6503]|uniref:helix-turn-helix domain-containing protein n=1 Tax=Ruminococcus sp. Marseille-P6503 TaxID=2364796 RepID=UPI0013DD92A4|nr:helix-turn-helix domain-containing protein [Ruminococcus sp. Marseille-P6503]
MKRYYKVPNVMFELKLSASAFVIYVLITNRFYFTGTVKIKLHTLSAHTGFCVNTVQTAIKELHSKDLLKVIPRFKNGRRTTNEYILNRLQGNFSRIDRRLFYFILSKAGKSALMVYCAVNHCANTSGRAFPSYNQISSLTGLSRATCISKVKLLGELGTLAREHYVCTAGDYGHNNYVTVSLKLRFFLFNIILSSYRKAKEKAARLHMLLKLRCAGFGHTRGGINFDKHIKNPPKYLNIEKNSILHTFTKISDTIHDNLQKFCLQLRSGFMKLLNVLRS